MKTIGLCPKCSKKIEGIKVNELVTASYEGNFDSDSDEYTVIEKVYQGCCPVCGYTSKSFKNEKSLFRHFSTDTVLSVSETIDTV